MDTASSVDGPLRVKLKRSNGGRLDVTAVWNISLGGLFLELNEPLPFGEDLHLEIELAGQPQPVACKGFVVWSTKDSPGKAAGRRGAAVRLIDLGIAEMRTIAARVGQDL